MKDYMGDRKHVVFAYFSAIALFGFFAVALFGAKVLAQTASQGGAGGNPSCSLPAGQDVFAPAEQYVPVFNPATDKPTDSKFFAIYPLAAPHTPPPLADFSPAFLDDFTNRVYGVPFAKLKRITDPAIKAKFDAAAHIFAHGSLHVPEDQGDAEYDEFNKEIAQGLSGGVIASSLNRRALVFQKAGLSVGEVLLNYIDVETRSPGRSTYGLDAEPNEATLQAYFHLLNELYKKNIPQYQFFFDWNKSIGFSNTGAAWGPQGYVFDWRRNGWTADGYPTWWSAGAANCAPSSSSSQNQTIPPPATTTVDTVTPQSPEEILNFQQSQNDALLQLLRQLQQASGQVGGANTQSGATVNNPNINNAAANNSSFCHTFNANLSIDSSGDDVSALRAILIKEGFPAAATGDFDETLASYVSGFQEKYANDVLTPAGLKSGTGYVGSRTRAKLNALYGCASSGSGSGQSSSPSSSLSQPLSLSNLQNVLKQISDKYAQLLNQSVALGQRSVGQGAGGGTGAPGGNNNGNGGNGGSQNAPATLSFSPSKQSYCVGDSITWSVNSNPAGLNADLYRTHNGVQDIAGDKKFSVKTNYTSDPYAFNANDVGNWSLFYRVDTGNGSSVNTNTFTTSVNSCSNTSAAQDQQCETLFGVACASLLRISDPYVRDRFDHFAGVGGTTTAEAHPGIPTPLFETIGLSPGEALFNAAHFYPATYRLSFAPSVADMSSLRAIFDGLNAGVGVDYHFDWTSGLGFRCDGVAWGPNGFDTNWQTGGYTSAGLPTWWHGGWGGTACPIPAP